MPFIDKLKSLWITTTYFFVSSDENIRGKRRLVLGVFVLLLVNVIWVASAELSSYIFKGEGYNKPFFTTYFKTTAFMMYLVGFLFYHPWQLQCMMCFRRKSSNNITRSFRVNPSNEIRTTENSSLLSSPESSRCSSPSLTQQRQYLTESTFEPITDEELNQASERENDPESASIKKHVHFNSYREVRHLQGREEAANLARMPHDVTERLKSYEEKISLLKVAKIAMTFCFLWFLATWGYQEALNDTSAASVNILSSSSGLFTLLLASAFKSSSADQLTLSKVIAVIISICGIVMVTLSDSQNSKGGISYGAIWALCSAFLYACYLVFLKKKVPDESKIDVPMFFGFVGLFNLVLLWPGFLALHYTGMEPFQLPPNLNVWGYLTLNAVVGTVLSEFLWLWGCFLTSSLTATLSLSLVIPLTMLTDIFMNRVKFHWLFLVGTIPVVMSFFAVSLLAHYTDWDPVMSCIKKCIGLIKPTDTQDGLDGEQREGLISNEEQPGTNGQVPS